MKKRVITILAAVLVVILALFAFAACNNADSGVGEELVKNGSFTSFGYKPGTSDFQSFDDWSFYSSKSGATYGKSTPSDPTDSDVRLFLDNSTAMYSNMHQTIAVTANKIYKVSVDIWIVSENGLSGDGAYVSFLENTEYMFVRTRKHSDQFETYTFYVRPKNTDYLTIALCLGSESRGVSGRVLFDNISVQRVDKADVPGDATIINFRKARTLANDTNVSGILFVVFLSLFTVAILVAAYILLRRLYASRKAFVNFGDNGAADGGKLLAPPQDGKWFHNGIFIAAALMLGTFLVRLIFLLSMNGMGKVMTDLVSTARNLGLRNGIPDYLLKNSGTTMSPGTLYILAVIGAMGNTLLSESVSILIRFVNVLADMAVVAMIYFYGKKRVGNRLSTIYAALYAIAPFVFVMSGLVGSFESVLVALLLATVILMVNKQYLATYFMATLASVFDIRAMAIAPIIVAYFVYMYIKDNADIKKFTSNRAQIVFGLVACFILGYILTLPLAIDRIAAGDAFYGFKVIVGELTNNTTFVNNAFNLYGMVTMNGKTLTRGVAILNFIFILVLEAYAISLYFKNRNRQELVLLVSFVFAVLSVFTVKADYTYLLLALAFAFIYTMISGDKRMYLVTSGYTLLGFLQVGQLLNQSGMIAMNPTTSLTNYETTNPFYIIFCVLTVLLTGYYVYVVYSITNNTKIVDIKPMPEPFGKTVKTFMHDLKLRLGRKAD